MVNPLNTFHALDTVWPPHGIVFKYCCNRSCLEKENISPTNFSLSKAQVRKYGEYTTRKVFSKERLYT